MAPYITATELRTFLEPTPLPNAALETIIADATKAIDASLGPIADHLYLTVRPPYPSREIVLPHRAAVVSAVTEHATMAYREETTTVLAANDFVLRLCAAGFGYRIERLMTGDHPAVYWATLVDLVWTPFDDADRRKLAIIDLAKLEIARSGHDSRRMGDVSEASADHEKKRAAIIRRIAPKAGVVIG